MLKSFTRNYEDNSTESGFQFTFYCDICSDGYKTSFVESETYKKGSKIRGFGEGLWAAGSLFGGALGNLGWAADRGSSVLSERFKGMSPEWQKEHEQAFERALNEARRHFHRCESCHKWVCTADFNEEEGLCVVCAPRRSVAVTRARSQAMQRNIDEAAASETVWSGKLKTETIICPACGKPNSSGKFCNSCGASLSVKKCPSCGANVTGSARFCGECGEKL